MAALIPFRALRPTLAAAERVAAVPYDVVSREEAAVLARGNALSFLHVSRAEIDLSPTTDPYSEVVYQKAVENFRYLQTHAPLVFEDSPALYAYRLTSGNHQQTGVAACFSMDEYATDAIKKHERTRRDKEDDRTRHMLALAAQTGPVFLTYRAISDVQDIVQRTASVQPLFDFVAHDGVRHSVWRVESPEERALVNAFSRVPALYIADGHHRAASAARARDELQLSRGSGEWDAFLGVAFPHDQVRILPYNRIIKDLAGQSAESILGRLRERFAVGPGPAVPRRRGEVAMFLAGQWYVLSLGAAPSELPPAERLDVTLLQNLILTPLFGIGDVRTDKRIDFVGGGRGVRALEALVTSGEAAIAFSMYPVSVDDLMSIADAGGIMPPKSTWFEPKLRDGLLSHAF